MENCLANCTTRLISKYLKLLQKIRMVVLALLLKVGRRQTLSSLCRCRGNAAKWAAETVSVRAVCWWIIMWQEASSNYVGQTPYFLHSLYLTKSKPCYYQPLNSIWLSMIVLTVTESPSLLSSFPSSPALIITIDLWFSRDFICSQTSLLSCPPSA